MTEQVIVSYAIEEAALTELYADDLDLKLYSNDYTPTAAMTSGSFTEPTGGGYADKTILTTDWTLESNDPRDIIVSGQAFSFTGALDGGATIYGWYLYSGEAVKAAKRLDTPFTPAESGDSLTFTPRIQAGNGTPG